jgi:hypothetical protein
MTQPTQKWMEIVDSIFKKQKERYNNFTDNDKKDSFYIINKKFYLGESKITYFFNDKNIDTISALDLWFLFFQKNPKYKNIFSAPYWYWAKSPNKKEKEIKAKKSDKEMFIDYEKLTEKEFDFLYKYYQDDVDYKIKLLKRLD